MQVSEAKRLHQLEGKNGRLQELLAETLLDKEIRDECLNASCFYSLDDARVNIKKWIKDYNQERPHSALGGLTPMEYERAQLQTLRVA